MVKFSVVVPAYNVQGYLRQAVSSVAHEDDTEVIVVDDRSTDGTAELADALADTHPTVRVVRPDVNSGLGEARNLGLKHAVGDYVLFLDGDDYFAPGAFAQIRASVDAHHPDIVMFGYARLYPNGKREEGIIRGPLAGFEPFRASERLDIYTVLNVAWNKAYRRDFLAEVGLTFPRGYYEDIPWTYPLLSQARSIAPVDAPLYMYRQRGSGSILRSTDARHIEIVDQFDRLMSILAEYDLDPVERRMIFDCAFRNLSTLASHQRARIPAARRREFFERVQQSVRAHAPAGYEPPAEGHQAREMRWIWEGTFATFERQVRSRSAARAARERSRTLARSVARSLKRSQQRRIAYRATVAATRVDENLVVMENLWGRAPSLNCLAVDRELRRTHPDLSIVWLVTPAETGKVPADIDYVAHGSREHFLALARAKYLFVDANLPGWWRKRGGQVLTQLHHGTPLKLMGVEERGKTPEWRDGLLRRCSNWDFSVVSNSYSTEVWQHSYPVRCTTLEYGYPRNDALVNASEADVAAARERVGVAPGQRVILYMPTFRPEDQMDADEPDLDAVTASLGETDVLLVRSHYFASAGEGSRLGASVRDVSDYAKVDDLYLAADVMVTDYSSAMFDFSNLRRPIVVFAYDWERYSEHRGTYFDITVDAPGAVARSSEELARILEAREYDDPKNRGRLERFAAIFGEFDQGTAAQDIVTRVVDGVTPPSRRREPVPHLTSWMLDRQS
ncbi:bifunctional glycosyltransferase family 2 protein/CDP-glycerol:glycerophosphate glycerophosphotransferase [Demequina sp. NBRC 110056]|uniref:bifunctional glycosyltransferase/CDP-glycerol:glycerophosphate glycerophosphotransferase n=1 Tax=Demequina sp. NBRC 110056 TaxID=1570345 RepID=UPI0009FC165F|nr:bifunctional glycosyltransferase family 2 protein/CDP-glycerol:glycerophosphate glycerophosphotransferase [Demequina sp. NBRC 110056]